MLEHLIDHYIAVSVSVFSILTLLAVVKKAVENRLGELGILWWFVAWILGFGSAFLSPDCIDQGWRCWANAGLTHGGLALILYPLTKRITKAIRDRVATGLKQ